MQGHVAIVDTDSELMQQLGARLTQRGVSVEWQNGPTAAPGHWDVLVSRVEGNDPERPLMVTGRQSGVEAVYLPPFDVDLLMVAIGSSLNRLGLDGGLAPGGGEGLSGSSPAIRAAGEMLMQLASSEASVLLSGETGTGKELAARLLHRHSRRSAGPFVALNCAAVPEQLLESELFGHTKGAYTDARDKRNGLLVYADRGTLFLDEIGELPLGLQPRLLRALQERTVRPVGANTEVPFDVRIIAATHRDLESEVRAGRFREDLYYRLNVVEVELPPLRARGNDVLLLAQHFLRRFAQLTGRRIMGLSAEAAEALKAYPWPGNVRELQNYMERAVALATTDYVMLSDLPPRVRQLQKTVRPSPPGNAPVELLPLAEVERRHIVRVLEAMGGNKRAAAQVLGVDRRTLYRKLERAHAPPQSAPCVTLPPEEEDEQVPLSRLPQ